MNYFKTDILKKEFKNTLLKNFLLQKISVKKFFGVEKKMKPKNEKRLLILKFIIKAKNIDPMQ